MIEPTTGKEKEMENTTRAHLSLALQHYWKKVDVLIHLLLLKCRGKSQKNGFIRQDSGKCNGTGQVCLECLPDEVRLEHRQTNKSSTGVLKLFTILLRWILRVVILYVSPGIPKHCGKPMLYIASLFYVKMMLQQMWRLTMALPIHKDLVVKKLQYFTTVKYRSSQNTAVRRTQLKEI